MRLPPPRGCNPYPRRCRILSRTGVFAEANFLASHGKELGFHLGSRAITYCNDAEIIALFTGAFCSAADKMPNAELEWWYQFYFATERGRLGYEKYRHDFNKLIWQLASPKWQFGSIAVWLPSATQIMLAS